MGAGVLLCISAVALSGLVHSVHTLPGSPRGVSHHGPCTGLLELLSHNEAVEGSDFTHETLPECDHHGNFVPKQCHVLTEEEVGEIWCLGNEQEGGGCFQTNNGRTYQVSPGEKWCHCVDPLTGHWNKSTATPASEDLYCKGLHYGPCHEMLWKIQNHMPVEHEDFIDGMMPMCDDHGNFLPKQCHTFKKGDSWCKDGETGDDCYHFEEGEEWCICVNPLTAHPDDRTAKPAELELHCGKCHEMLEMIENHIPVEYEDYTPDMVPECDDFGNFKPKQCHEFKQGDKWCEDDDPDYCYHFDDGEGWCICVDPLTGHMDKDSPAPAEEELHCREHSGLCLKVLWLIHNNKTMKHGDFRDDFLPECDDHGNLKPKQCHVFERDDQWCDDEGHCHNFTKGQEWCICVDPHSGMPLPATFTPAGDDLHCGPKPTPCHDWVWMIENNKTKKHGDFRDDFVPECDVHGLFRPKQCHTFKRGDKWCNMEGHCHYFKDKEEWCICMDPHTGETNDSTATKNGAELHCGPPSGPCLDLVYMIENNMKEKHGDFRDDFVPECDDHGNFKPKQCHVFKRGDKWCDDSGHHCHYFDHGEEWCICMDPYTGETKEDTATPAGEELYCGDKPRCPKGWSYFSEHDHEHCFIFINTSMTWVDAERYCQFDGGHLASIHCQETEYFLQLLTRGKTHKFPITWVGATNAVDPCLWIWLDGLFFDYENWEKEAAKLHADSCLQINHGCNAVHFKWSSGHCNETHPFICALEPGLHKDLDHYQYMNH